MLEPSHQIDAINFILQSESQERRCSILRDRQILFSSAFER